MWRTPILDHLRADHREALALLETIVHAVDDGERDVLFTQFAREFAAHTGAEEAILYEELATYDDTRILALRARASHRVVAALIADLQRTVRKTGDDWSAQCMLLHDLFDLHVRRVEDSLFEGARATFNARALKAMGARYAEEKARRLR